LWPLALLTHVPLAAFKIHSGGFLFMRQFFIAVLLFFWSAGQGWAAIKEPGKELHRVQRQIRLVERQLKQIQLEKQTLIQQLAKIEREYGDLARSLKELQARISDKRRRLQEIEKKSRVFTGKIDQQRQALQGQVRAAYAMGPQEKLKLILNQQDPLVSSRMMVYYDYFNKARLHRLAIIEENLQALKKLEREKRQETQSLERTATKKQAGQEALAAVKKTRGRLLAKLNQHYGEKKQQLRQMQDNARELQKLVDSLRKAAEGFPFEAGPSKPFGKLRGQLPWPIRGRLVKHFGSKRAGGSHWHGVLIAAREGVEIHAVARGRVVYADWLRGYGLLAIIDHGRGYMTLYAFTQSLFKEMGDWVEAGDVIATVGKSGGRSRAGLYFGIRKKGRPVNPVKWCRKVRKGRTG